MDTIRSKDPHLKAARAEYEAAVKAVLSPPPGARITPLRERLRAALVELQTLEANADTPPSAPRSS
jgi:hypothetical protein